MTNLTNGETYTFTVSAKNSIGESPQSAPSNSVAIGTAPPLGLSCVSSTLTCVKGTACSLAAPTRTGGAIVSYSVSPALPDGLVLSSANGAINGTPTVVAAAANYTVTASNPGGVAAAVVTIPGNDVPPTSLTHSPASLDCTVRIACAIAAPTSMGGAVVSHAINPALPAGLTLNPVLCGISGTPTVASPATHYVVPATNSGGSTTASISVFVTMFRPPISPIRPRR